MNSNEQSPPSELKWDGLRLLQGELVIAQVVDHRRWWTVKSTRNGTPEQRLSKKDYPTLATVQHKYASELLVSAYTLRDPTKRMVAVALLQKLLKSR